jgi:hypothetical protein
MKLMCGPAITFNKWEQNKCESLMSFQNKIEEEVQNLISHSQKNMMGYSQVERCKHEAPERAGDELEEELPQSF